MNEKDQKEKPRPRFQIITRAGLKRLAGLFVAIALLLLGGWWTMMRMPGTSFTGPLPALTEAQRTLAVELQRDVIMLAETIGPRHVDEIGALNQAADYIEHELRAAGLDPQRQEFEVRGRMVANIEAEIKGAAKPEEIIVIGAHYDSVYLGTQPDCPGANDNASGTAGTLALARRFAALDTPPARTVRFVFFVNEEPPHFQRPAMGSLVYAARCRARNENIIAMLSLETIGCYTDQPDSQKYPLPLGGLYPTTGDFISFVGNFGSRALVRDCVRSFRTHAEFPSEGAALPGSIAGVGWSDHWSFWQHGYPAIMLTDTAPFRYPFYHTSEDTPDKLDYDRMARVVEGVGRVVEEMMDR